MRLANTVLFLVLCNMLLAQKSSDVWIEARAKLGFLVAHRSIMGHLAKEHAHAVEISYLIQPKGRKSWHQAYRNPVFGITGFVGSVGNREVLGHYFSAFAFINFPFVKRKRYTLSGKLGSGLGYGTKYYKKNYPEDPSTILNVAVSTPINAHISLALENRFVFGNHSVNASIDMTHFSNGAIKVPNLGLNLPYVSVGYGYRIKKSRDSIFQHAPFDKYWEFGAVGILSVKEVFPTGGNKYPVYGLNLMGRRYFSHKTAMEVSFDFISKQAIFQYHSDVPKTQEEIIQLGIFAGYILPFDNFHILGGMGVYVRDKYFPEDRVYHRVGMRYVFDNGLNINFVLKTHWARADYVEYGIGYTFRK